MPSLCGELIHGRWLPDPAVISIHPPRVGWDQNFLSRFGLLQISIHPPRVGWDRRRSLHPLPQLHFNPPTPCGVGPPLDNPKNYGEKFQSTHPVWGGTCQLVLIAVQSTHPVWGGTTSNSWSGDTKADFNPPTPCGVGLRLYATALCLQGFQSTHPVWGGTPVPPAASPFSLFQSTHPVWGGTDWGVIAGGKYYISIHPPRVGWDLLVH